MTKPGEVLQAAIWLDGRETEHDLTRFSADVQEALDNAAAAAGVTIGRTNEITKRPGDDQVPPVPDHISGPNVRMLVIEAMVVGYASLTTTSLFTHELEPDDLERLRAITRVGYELHMPTAPRLTDRQCDTIINDLGPEAAEDALMQGVADVARVLH